MFWPMQNAMCRQDNRVISIVDDDESVRRSLRNLLISLGLRVRTYESAEAFLLSGHRDDTGCLILDLRMSGMSGLDLLKAQVAGRRVPTIVLTGHGNGDAHRRCLLAGAIEFLQKPVNAEVLREAIAKAMGESQ
jgi:two-component system, LuxR family, response regulator FixJ